MEDITSLLSKTNIQYNENNNPTPYNEYMNLLELKEKTDDMILYQNEMPIEDNIIPLLEKRINNYRVNICFRESWYPDIAKTHITEINKLLKEIHTIERSKKHLIDPLVYITCANRIFTLMIETMELFSRDTQNVNENVNENDCEEMDI